VTDQRVAAALRAIRIKRGWRQSDVAKRAEVSPSVISLIERGHLARVSVSAFRQVTAALEVRAEISLTLPHGELDRLLTSGHAAFHEAIARYLAGITGWKQAPEVSFSIFGERGVIDILAFHEETGSLLVIELKTEFVSLENLLATMDVRMRHARKIAAERGWHAKSVSAWVVFAESRTTRRRVARHSETLGGAFPADGRRMRAWLARPTRTIRSVSFWTDSNVSAARRNAAAPRRVRKPVADAEPGQTAA
jgi:transcriptional regulator with XRE-family HTH domain